MAATLGKAPRYCKVAADFELSISYFVESSSWTRSSRPSSFYLVPFHSFFSFFLPSPSFYLFPCPSFCLSVFLHLSPCRPLCLFRSASFYLCLSLAIIYLFLFPPLFFSFHLFYFLLSLSFVAFFLFFCSIRLHHRPMLKECARRK